MPGWSEETQALQLKSKTKQERELQRAGEGSCEGERQPKPGGFLTGEEVTQGDGE